MKKGERAGRDVLVKKYGSRSKRYLPPKKSKWKVKENIVSKEKSHKPESEGYLYKEVMS